MKLIKKDELHTAKWSGGSTTEIMIYPPEASYVGRQFEWRVSIATIEEEQTIFTKLKGFNRQTMVLEGTLKLNYLEQSSVNLTPYEQTIYQGDWKTTSEGVATNLNLITGPAISSMMKAEFFQTDYMNYPLSCIKDQNKEVHHLFIALEPFEVGGSLNSFLDKGDSLYLNENDILIDNDEIKLYSQTDSIQFIYIRFVNAL
ncbi:HutD family protein [Lysinibacillus sp. SGAir0095]|uniref:HutD family protein n=1 Tax=Lysinibacillus sp. SGAir0095 TaxID=2070463 RepID=UPI0010CD63C8|nr:HutD family protein [Lysinibacillus sp. SGAir0095]QCR32005.1 hypothetical protein C1N55_07385 [Lysinibacillus sp. SGAir0095]